jgi:SHOCT-like protein
MTENRRQVLEMLAEGKVTAEQAERLMAALERDEAGGISSVATQARPVSKVRFLRVVVDGVEDGGPLKVNVRVPLQLLRAGVRLASLIPSAAQGPVNEALRKEGIAIDLTQIKPENLEDLIDSLDELTVDVVVNDKSDTIKVRVFCE